MHAHAGIPTAGNLASLADNSPVFQQLKGRLNVDHQTNIKLKSLSHQVKSYVGVSSFQVTKCITIHCPYPVMLTVPLWMRDGTLASGA